MDDLLEELREVTTTRRKWWVVKFKDGYYGEHFQEVDDEGFSMALYSTKALAEQAARDFLDGEDFPFEVVEICFSEVR